jgi:soluble lytic murein transglycosylase-like protein
LKSVTIVLGFLVTVLWLGGACAAQSLSEGKAFDEHALLGVVGSLYGIDPGLLEAIATAESNNNPAAMSDKGARGLMQLMPATAWQFKVIDPFDPVQNVLGAARFLDYLRKHTGRDLPELLAAYNAGEGAVKFYHGVPPYPETRQYVRKVLWLYLFGTAARQSDANRQRVNISVEAHKAARFSFAKGDDQVLNQLDAIKHARAAAVQNQ